MAFSTTDLQTIKAAINGDSTMSGMVSTGAFGALADYLNQPSATLIWMPDVPVTVLLTCVVWSAFISATSGQQAAWAALTGSGTVDATSSNIRAGFVSIFGAGTATVTNLIAAAQRNATRVEALFTTSSVTTRYNQAMTEALVHSALAS